MIRAWAGPWGRAELVDRVWEEGLVATWSLGSFLPFAFQEETTVGNYAAGPEVKARFPTLQP